MPNGLCLGKLEAGEARGVVQQSRRSKAGSAAALVATVIPWPLNPSLRSLKTTTQG